MVITAVGSDLCCSTVINGSPMKDMQFARKPDSKTKSSKAGRQDDGVYWRARIGALVRSSLTGRTKKRVGVEGGKL